MVECASFSAPPILEVGMEELFKELLSFVEGDAKWWDDAAQHCERLAIKLSDEEKAKWELLAAVYHERAKVHRELVGKMRQRSGG
jgi:hypothetical protein